MYHPKDHGASLSAFPEGVAEPQAARICSDTSRCWRLTTCWLLCSGVNPSPLSPTSALALPSRPLQNKLTPLREALSISESDPVLWEGWLPGNLHGACSPEGLWNSGKITSLCPGICIMAKLG